MAGAPVLSTAGWLCTRAASGKSVELPAQGARRWLTHWAAATVHRVTSSRLGNRVGIGAA